MTDNPTTDRHMAIKVVMMPRDTNPHGTIFGGVLLNDHRLADEKPLKAMLNACERAA